MELTWRLSPYYCVAMKSAALDRVLISEQFEFSASHRLHLDSLDAKRNRELFGTSKKRPVDANSTIST